MKLQCVIFKVEQFHNQCTTCSFLSGSIPLDRVGVICNCNIKINSNLPFFNVIASNQLLSG